MNVAASMCHAEQVEPGSEFAPHVLASTAESARLHCEEGFIWEVGPRVAGSGIHQAVPQC